MAKDVDYIYIKKGFVVYSTGGNPCLVLYIHHQSHDWTGLRPHDKTWYCCFAEPIQYQVIFLDTMFTPADNSYWPIRAASRYSGWSGCKDPLTSKDAEDTRQLKAPQKIGHLHHPLQAQGTLCKRMKKEPKSWKVGRRAANCHLWSMTQPWQNHQLTAALCPGAGSTSETLWAVSYGYGRGSRSLHLLHWFWGIEQHLTVSHW